MSQKTYKPARKGSLHNNDLDKPRFAKAYSFALVTGLFFLLSWPVSSSPSW